MLADVLSHSSEVCVACVLQTAASHERLPYRQAGTKRPWQPVDGQGSSKAYELTGGLLAQTEAVVDESNAVDLTNAGARAA